MSKKEKEKKEEPETGQPQEVTEEYRQETEGEAKSCTFSMEQMQKLEALAKENSELKDSRLRLAAEYDNYRKRTAKEKETIYQDAKVATVKMFLEVYDNLERAVQQEGGEDNVHKKGMEMIFHQLEADFDKLGITILDPKGEPFDPEKHDAVMHVDDESLGEGIVAKVFQKGFLLGDKVIRFASVQVAN